MGHTAEQHEDVPHAVEVGTAVVGEEVGAGGVEQPFRPDGAECGSRDVAAHGFGHEDEGPTHEQIDEEGKSREAVDGRDFVDGTTHGYGPQQAEHGPAIGSAHHAHADGGVGSGYHDVDADVVQHTQAGLALAGHPPMVEGAGGIHQQHATGKKGDPEGILPIALVAEFEYHPGRGQCKHDSGQMRERVEHFLAASLS